MARKSIYPIPIELSTPAGVIKAGIVKMTSVGVLVNTFEHPILVHKIFTGKFALPLTRAIIECKFVVVKTYDEFKGKHGLIQPGNHVNELHFKGLTKEVRSELRKFLALFSVTAP